MGLLLPGLLAKKYGLSRLSRKARPLYPWNIADPGRAVRRQPGHLS